MPTREIRFGEYLPDGQGVPFDKDPGYLVAARNVRPIVGGYRPSMIDAEVTDAATLGATPIVAAAFSGQSTNRYFVGTSTGLYESGDVGQSWNDNSKTVYTASADWDFELFDDYVIAVNGIDAPQSKLLSASDSTNFDDLADNPPVAARVSRVRDHVVFGALTGVTDGSFAIQTSAIGNPGSYPTVGSAEALANQSIRQFLPGELGVITDIVGGERFGLVFQVEGITRMMYVGGNVVYQFDTFERSVGTGYRHSAISVGKHVYFASALGFFRTDGYTVENLSRGKIDDSIVRNLTSLTEGGGYGYSVAYDSRTQTVMWNGAVGYILCYHIPFDRFTINVAVGDLGIYTLHSCRNEASTETTVSIPFAFNATPRLVEFTDGTGVPCELQTGYVELEPGAYTQITGIEPIGVLDSYTVSAKSLSGRNEFSSSGSGFTSATSSRSGINRIRSTGRYHAFYLGDSANSNAVFNGLRVHYEPSSRL